MFLRGSGRASGDGFEHGWKLLGTTLQNEFEVNKLIESKQAPSKHDSMVLDEAGNVSILAIQARSLISGVWRSSVGRKPYVVEYMFDIKKYHILHAEDKIKESPIA